MHRLFLTQALAGQWANGIVNAELAKLAPSQWTQACAMNFGSMQGIANHLLLADRLWLHRLGGGGEAPASVAAVPCPEVADYIAARRAQDERVVAFFRALAPERLAETLRFRTIDGTPKALAVALCLAHMLNHQTHHRGQLHALLGVHGQSCPDIDLLYAPEVKMLAAQDGKRA